MVIYTKHLFICDYSLTFVIYYSGKVLLFFYALLLNENEQVVFV